MEYITLKEKTGLKRFGIRTADGQDTGKYIEIDLEDLDLPIKANECQVKHIENFENLKAKLTELEGLPDTKAKNEVISEKARKTIEAYKEFYKAEEQALDEFLGKGATESLLNGRKPYITMYDDINEYLEQIVPALQETQENLKARIEAKYKDESEDNIL